MMQTVLRVDELLAKSGAIPVGGLAEVNGHIRSPPQHVGVQKSETGGVHMCVCERERDTGRVTKCVYIYIYVCVCVCV